ncbi:MAG: hypothetical protein D6705_05115 [Deltaproteobacteria bacterium]|nr:MAG: hypothetical protein D6705_05115 [Deltaproteobacteria bacterium]
MFLAWAPVPVAHAAAGPAADQVEEAKRLYREGKTAFDVGRWEDAVAAFEESYAKSGNELLLFNIGLSYYRWWEESGDIKHLRKARSVLKTFVARAQRNPERLGDPSEAQAQLELIEQKLEEAEQRERDRRTADHAEQDTGEQRAKQPPPPVAEPDEGASRGPTDVPPAGPDPGRKLKLGGIAAMAVGGVAVVTGVVVGAIHVGNSVKFDRDLRDTDDQIEENGLTDADIAQFYDGATCETLPQNADEVSQEYCTLKERRATIVRNGKRANLYAALGFAIGGGLGVALLATGGALYAVGNKKSKAAARDRALRISPQIGIGYAGIGLSGRF